MRTHEAGRDPRSQRTRRNPPGSSARFGSGSRVAPVAPLPPLRGSLTRNGPLTAEHRCVKVGVSQLRKSSCLLTAVRHILDTVLGVANMPLVLTMDSETRKFLEEFRAEVNARFEAAADERAALRSRLEEAADERAAIQSRLEGAADERAALRSRLEEAADERAAIQSRLEGAADERAALRSRLEEAADERAAIQSRLEEASTERELMWGVLVENIRHEHRSLKEAKKEASKGLLKPPARKRRRARGGTATSALPVAAKDG